MDAQNSPHEPAHPDDGSVTPTSNDAAQVIRSEEQLQTRLHTVAKERVRLVKRIVTEDVTFTVAVSHEEVSIEREPITDANRGDAIDGVELDEHSWDLVLYTEKVEITKTTVPVERVQLNTRIVTEQHEITDTLRKEEFDIDQTPPER